MIGNNGSFGGNPLVESIGLGDATTVDSLVVTWPTSKTTQTFRHLAADQAIEITEGNDAYRVVTRKPLAIPKLNENPSADRSGIGTRAEHSLSGDSASRRMEQRL